MKNSNNPYIHTKPQATALEGFFADNFSAANFAKKAIATEAQTTLLYKSFLIVSAGLGGVLKNSWRDKIREALPRVNTKLIMSIFAHDLLVSTDYGLIFHIQSGQKEVRSAAELLLYGWEKPFEGQFQLAIGEMQRLIQVAKSSSKGSAAKDCAVFELVIQLINAANASANSKSAPESVSKSASAIKVHKQAFIAAYKSVMITRFHFKLGVPSQSKIIILDLMLKSVQTATDLLKTQQKGLNTTIGEVAGNNFKYANALNKNVLDSVIATLYLQLPSEFLPFWKSEFENLLPKTNQVKAWTLFTQQALVGKSIGVCKRIPKRAHRDAIYKFASEIGKEAKPADWDDYLLRTMSEISKFEEVYAAKQLRIVRAHAVYACKTAQLLVGLSNAHTLPAGTARLEAEQKRTQAILHIVSAFEPRFLMRDSGEMRFSQKAQESACKVFIKIAIALKQAMLQSPLIKQLVE